MDAMEPKPREKFGLGYLTKGGQGAQTNEAPTPAASGASERVLAAVGDKVLKALEAKPGQRMRELVDETGLDYDVLLPAVEWLSGNGRVTVETDRYGDHTVSLAAATASGG